jgi:hypothetical protein
VGYSTLLFLPFLCLSGLGSLSVVPVTSLGALVFVLLPVFEDVPEELELFTGVMFLISEGIE